MDFAPQHVAVLGPDRAGLYFNQATLDLHGGYKFKIRDNTLALALDVFNVFNAQEATAFDDNVESSTAVPDPDFLKVKEYQTPRRFRVSARWRF